MNPFQDPVLGRLDRDTRLFYLGLVQLHQTGGPILDDDAFLKAQVFPYDNEPGTGVTLDDISGMLHALEKAEKISRNGSHITIGVADGLFEAPHLMIRASMPPKPTVVKKQAPPVPARLVDFFDEFWAVYPRRTGKGAARKAFIGAVGNGTPATVIIEGAIRFRDNCVAINKEVQFIPHPATWLNQERWEDDAEAAEQVRSKADDVMRANLSLVQYYEQQEMLERGGGMLELEQ